MSASHTLLGPTGRPLPQGIGQAVRAMSSYGTPAAKGGDLTAGYGGAGPRAGTVQGQDLAGWVPGQTSADASWLWNRDLAVSRTRDLLANEPWAQGAVDRKLDMVVGAGWRPSIRPALTEWGVDEKTSLHIGNQIERGWRLWGDDPLCRCDMEETQTASWLLHTMVMEHEVTGDGLGVLRWRERADWPFRTALQLVDADRLSNPWGRPDSDTLRGGVETDPDSGAPSLYHIRNSHPGDMAMATSPRAYDWEAIERREWWGRPRVLHLFEKRRPGQTRGISRLVAGLSRFKQMQRFAEGEIANAVINALFAATITSSFDPAVAQEHLTAAASGDIHQLRNAFYETTPPLMGGARIQHLFPGDELKFMTDPRDTASFESFFTVFLRSIASGLGIAYEQIAMDWSKVNYSSARAALIEVWRGIMKTRSLVAMMVATPMLLAVTEDAMDLGLIDIPDSAPGLYEAPAAWLRGRWIGPARGWVDPVKEPAGAVLQMSLGATTGEDIAAEQGMELDAVIPQLAREKAQWEAHGIMPPTLRDMLEADERFATPPHQESAAA